MVTETKVSAKNLLSHLERFSAEVNNDKYKKLEYNIWRELRDFLNRPRTSDVEISKNIAEGTIQIGKTPFSAYSAFLFSINDNSFGQYLDEHLVFTSSADTSEWLNNAVKQEVCTNIGGSGGNDKTSTSIVANFNGIPIYETPVGGLENGTYIINTPGSFTSDKVKVALDDRFLNTPSNLHYSDKTEDISKSDIFSMKELTKLTENIKVAPAHHPSITWGTNIPAYVSNGLDEVRTNLETLSNDMKNIKEDIYTLQPPSSKGNNKNKENKNEKEKNMFNLNFDFGSVDGEKVRMSPYGMAIQNREGVFVSYDAENDKITNVDVFNFDGSKFMYKMPVALSAVQVGDVVIHNHKPMFVTEVQGNRLSVIDVYEGESKAVIPTTNMFGFDFVTKVVSFIDMVGTPSKDNPFGNMLPFLMMGDNSNDNDFLMFMAMSQMNTDGNVFQNPMFLMAMMKDDSKSNSKDDMLKMMMLSQAFSKMPFSQVATHKVPPVVVNGTSVDTQD